MVERLNRNVPHRFEQHYYSRYDFRLWHSGLSALVSPSIILSLLFPFRPQHPSSARWGRGNGFPSTSLYVTEGCGFFSWQTSCRVLEFPNAQEYATKLAQQASSTSSSSSSSSQVIHLEIAERLSELFRDY
jgi:hypothetical protein